MDRKIPNKIFFEVIWLGFYQEFFKISKNIDRKKYNNQTNLNEIGTKMKPIEESSCCSQCIEIIGLYYDVSIFQVFGIVSSQWQLSKSIQSGSLYISYIL